MKIKISELKEKLISSLVKRGLDTKGAELISNALIEAEVTGKKTHGISKVFMMEDAIKLREGKSEIVKDKGNYALINAHKEMGQVSAEFATDILIRKAKEFDNAVIATVNSYYFSMASIYARKVAKAGFVSMILTNGGPATISTFGGIDPQFGTNPIAIGIPTKTDPIVLDMATGERPWGEVNLAKIEKRNLQDKTFLDIDGNFTTDPYKVNAILPFGGYKGSGLNMMFEIMTGALTGAKMGLSSHDTYDIGSIFMAYSPTMFTTLEKFTLEVEQLVKEIKSSRKMEGVSDIYLPGERSWIKYKEIMKLGELDLEKTVWNQLLEFEKGMDVKSKDGLKA